MTSPLPTSECPVCHYAMDAATCIDDPSAKPSSGDLSLCLNCGEVLQFNDILVLKPIDLDTTDKATKAILLRISTTIKQRGRFK